MDLYLWWVEYEVDKRMTSYQKFNEIYILESGEQYDYKIQETVLSPSWFINQKDEIRCYLKSTIQLKYQNIIFGELILNVDYEDIFHSLNIDNNNFLSHQ